MTEEKDKTTSNLIADWYIFGDRERKEGNRKLLQQRCNLSPHHEAKTGQPRHD